MNNYHDQDIVVTEDGKPCCFNCQYAFSCDTPNCECIREDGEVALVCDLTNKHVYCSAICDKYPIERLTDDRIGELMIRIL